MSSKWIPELVYEESEDGDGQLGNLPMIHVPDGEEMPAFLLVWDVRSTGEFEPGVNGEDVPVVEQDLRQYGRMDILKDKLSSEDYDKVRIALGLKPLNEATVAGKKISEKVRNSVELKQIKDKS